jgi:hypothetical protein
VACWGQRDARRGSSDPWSSSGERVSMREKARGKAGEGLAGSLETDPHHPGYSIREDRRPHGARGGGGYDGCAARAPGRRRHCPRARRGMQGSGHDLYRLVHPRFAHTGGIERRRVHPARCGRDVRDNPSPLMRGTGASAAEAAGWQAGPAW